MEQSHKHVPSDCSRVAPVLSRIGDKWTILVVMLLGEGPMRFNELRRRVGAQGGLVVQRVQMGDRGGRVEIVG